MLKSKTFYYSYIIPSHEQLNNLNRLEVDLLLRTLKANTKRIKDLADEIDESGEMTPDQIMNWREVYFGGYLGSVGNADMTRNFEF